MLKRIGKSFLIPLGKLVALHAKDACNHADPLIATQTAATVKQGQHVVVPQLLLREAELLLGINA